ncbi:hypothetical protein BKA93DRAFT_801675 [Sparassis latifolia]
MPVSLHTGSPSIPPFRRSTKPTRAITVDQSRKPSCSVIAALQYIVGLTLGEALQDTLIADSEQQPVLACSRHRTKGDLPTSHRVQKAEKCPNHCTLVCDDLALLKGLQGPYAPRRCRGTVCASLADGMAIIRVGFEVGASWFRPSHKGDGVLVPGTTKRSAPAPGGVGPRDCRQAS